VSSCVEATATGVSNGKTDWDVWLCWQVVCTCHRMAV